MIGTTLDHYVITRHLGSGGMGDVYAAADSKLGRNVAIKFLPEPFVHDAERIARFQREARVLAALSHPNIAGIFGLEESSGRHYLVLELVPGETLAERIRRGPIPVDEAQAIAKQIAEALESAHEKAIVHRDLKPANVKITPDGKVKVLDFGLAKAFDTGRADTNVSNSPTLSIAATGQGVILGTAAYMSPEQAKGMVVDRRTDLFAFGAVLYEMLTGKPAFPGETVSDILAAVIRAEPDWTPLPSGTPDAIRRLLRRCLQKDRSRRLDTAAAARIEIDEAQSEPVIPPTPVSILPSPRRRKLPWILVAALSVIVVAMAIPATRSFRRAVPDGPELRLEISTPFSSVPLQFALSPDGRSIVFVASGDGPQRLWLRALDKIDARPMAGTDGAEYPFWSTDGRSIGFFATGRLYRIDVDGGPPQQLANAPSGTGGAWNANGTILYTPNVRGGIFTIAASRSVPERDTRAGSAGKGDVDRFPSFLPDGRHFLFFRSGNAEVLGIYSASLDGGEPKRLMAADTFGLYLPPDRIAFVRDGTLVARRFDVSRGEVMGDPVTLADGVGSDASSGWSGFSVSRDGTVAYRTGVTRRQLTWYERTGKSVRSVGKPDTNGLLAPKLSPDERSVVVTRTVQDNLGIWLIDLLRGTQIPLTSDAGSESHAVWSPDGTRVAYESSRNWDIYTSPVTGSGAEELLVSQPDLQRPQDWSKNGFLAYVQLTKNSEYDIWTLETRGSARKAAALVATPADERNPQFSPDGRWIAYETNESTQFQIVVQSFPTPTAKRQISVNGGVQPKWNATGAELYFIAPDRKLMAATVTASGSAFDAGTPMALFQTRIASGGLADLDAQYAVSRDGRFLINENPDDSAAPITLILNWKPK